MENSINTPPLNLQDVILPQVALPLAIIMLSVMGLLALLLILWMGYKYVANKRIPPEKSMQEKRSLANIRQQWQRIHMDERKTAYFLAKILKEQLSQPSLPASCPPLLTQHNPEYKAQWQQVVAALNALRYQGEIQRLQAHYFDWIGAWIEIFRLENARAETSIRINQH